TAVPARLRATDATATSSACTPPEGSASLVTADPRSLHAQTRRAQPGRDQAGTGRLRLGRPSARRLNRFEGREVSMPTIKEAAAEFLANKRVAVTGVSREAKGHGSNVLYQRLGARGYEVFAVNPNAEEVEGDRSYHDLGSIPGGVEAVVIGTKPEIAGGRMRECAALGTRHGGMHARPR